MKITIQESGMNFGPFAEDSVLKLEKSELYKSLGNNIRSVEFIVYSGENRIIFIEAKSSSPKPQNNIDFDRYITEIYKKFVHSVDLFFATLVNRKADKCAEMPGCFREADYSRADIKLILIINGHKTEWLHPIRDALQQRLRRQIKTWSLKIAVMNYKLACDNQLIHTQK